MDIETKSAETEAQAICFLTVCPFVDEETNGSYPFANGLNRRNGLAYLCLGHFLYITCVEITLKASSSSSEARVFPEKYPVHLH
jgi:hypothetical protein